METERSKTPITDHPGSPLTKREKEELKRLKDYQVKQRQIIKK